MQPAHASDTYRLGIDLGGTKIEGIILDLNQKEVFRKRIPTESDKGYEHILGRIENLYRIMCAEISGQGHTLGMGIPGAIDRKSRTVKNANTVCLNGKRLRDDLVRLISHEIRIENDANCFAMAEALFGAGKGYELVFGVIMGTGCGGGIVYQGKVLSGHQSMAGEWGHMAIDPKGPLCYCGARGCVETFISGGGLEKRYQEEFGEPKILQDIIEDYRSGDSQALKAIRDFFERFGRAMANLLNVLDPDVVVIGGGVSNFRELYTLGTQEVAKCIFNADGQASAKKPLLETPMIRNKLGDSAGVIGAALIGQ